MAALLVTAAAAETIRVAVYSAPLSRAGPGLLLRDILREEGQAMAAAAIIRAVSPDILLLAEFDHDGGLAAARAFAGVAGGYPHVFALRPNSGMPTGLDMDGDGRSGDARDAQGYGRFAGDGGLALLSRWPIDTGAVRDFTPLLWRDLPGAVLPQLDGAPFPSAEAQALQRLSSTGHWVVPVDTPEGRLLILAHAATPPVFDGPEDRNGLRARDELRLWEAWLDGALGHRPDLPFVLLAKTNLDPVDGEGDTAAMAAFLARPDLLDPRPSSPGALLTADPGHRGDPALDTADWPDGAPGNLRVSYVLPSLHWEVLDGGTLWPAPRTPLHAEAEAAGPHRLVWADIRRQPGPHDGGDVGRNEPRHKPPERLAGEPVRDRP
ncbi:endonuclease/exonuclease/phosphatase family protein [Histidinibacterium lentulum]|uniref:endonuclease/exonuclease/phosphatase family protein n=1 Tax=Histidinibacterium lentulum TaxID=2480588 RepID=UPI001FE8B753|nr:endonuclease/exonuclease/phosphatase family protein [Histidinibacterium lentulum]